MSTDREARSAAAVDRFLLKRDRAVQAGAGTGKTHALVTQYLHLCAGLTALGQPLEPQRIAALTFTDKAAGEMIERLRQRVGRLMQAQPQDGAVEAAEPALAATALALGKAVPGREHWEKVLVQLGGAPVGTFHSFAGALLRRYPQLAGVDPDYVLLDEETATELELEAAERVVLLALEGDLPTVRSEQAAAAVAEYGFVGAGARGSMALVDWLCQVRRRRAEEGQRPEPDALCLGYRPAGLASALALALGAFFGGLQQIGQFVPLLGPKSAETAQDLLRRAHLLGSVGHGAMDLSRVAEVLPGGAAICQELGKLRARPGDDGTREALAAAKRQVKGGHEALAAVVHAGAAAPLAETVALLCAAVWDAYEDAKRRVSALDFTDLLRRARDVLRDHQAERRKVQERFGAILVDEFQDTNPLQSELLALLAPGDAYAVGPDGALLVGGERAGPGRLYIVGDRKQSIYEFRGADVGTFAGWCQAVVQAGGDAETLRVSRRSLPGVLALSNALFAQVMQPPAGAVLPGMQVGPQAGAAPGPGWLVIWDEARDALVPLREAALAQDEQPAAELLLPQDNEETAALLAADPLAVEADLVARRIRALNDAGRRYGDVAVLLRRFTHLDRYLQALRQEGIPHYVVKGRGFYDAQEIRDLTSALALLEDPEDTLALVSVLRSPLCGLSDESLVRLHLHQQQRLRLLALLKAESAGDLMEMGLPAGEAERLRRTVQTLRLLLLRGDRLGPAGCLQALCDATDLQVVLGGLPEGAQRVANLELLLHRARRFEESGGGLRGFVRWLRLLVDPNLGGGDALSPQAQIVDERDDVVRVMTIHQSKGLEFPVVVVPGCASRERVDSQQVAYDRDVGLGVALRRSGERVETLPWQLVQRVRRLRQEAESARLFYVAVTRARDLVIFAGEGRGMGRTWRGQLVAFRQSPRGGLLGTWQPAQRPAQGAPVVAAADPAEVQARTQAAALAIARAYRAPSRASPDETEKPNSVPLSLSAACDLAVCARRYHLLHGLLLRELRGPLEAPARAAASDEAPGLFGPAAAPGGTGPSGWLRQGVLAQRLLARADLRGDGADLAGLLAADGLDPAQPQVGEVRTRVQRLLKRLGDLLAGVPDDPAERQVLRALPFVLQLEPDGIALGGVFDLLVLKPGLVTLVDYHYAYAPEPEGPFQVLRRGLLSAALRRVYGDRDVRVGFAYLREADPAPRFSAISPEAEQAALQQVRAGIARALTAGGTLPEAREGLRALPLVRDTCAALGCGYRYRCHGERVPAAPVEADAAGPAGLPEGTDAPELPQHLSRDMPDMPDFNDEAPLGE